MNYFKYRDKDKKSHNSRRNTACFNTGCKGQAFICCHADLQTNICVAQEDSINYKTLFNDTHRHTQNLAYILMSPNDNRGIRIE